MLEIPLSFNYPYFSQETELFGLSFNLEFEWIELEKFWVMHIYDHQEEPLALGIRLHPNWPLFSHKGITFMMLDDKRLVAYESI
jgi:hypothetical protein